MAGTSRTPRAARTALLAALTLAGAGTATWFWQGTTHGEPTSPLAGSAAATAATHLGLPTPGTAASAAPTTQATAGPSTEPARSASAPAARPRVGAEGYGPHIDRAHAGQDPKAAWESVQWLRDCNSNEARRTHFEQFRNQGFAPQFMTQRMVDLDAEARRCQTVTAAQRALLPQLATRAMRAGIPEVASVYASTVFAGDLTPDQRQEVAQAMRRDAQAGDVPSLLGALLANEAWGLTDEERLTYLAGYAALGGQHAQAVAKALLDNGQIRFKTKPTPEQLDAALRKARPWLEGLRPPGKG